MNKLITKIATACVGLAMAVGVGVGFGVGSSKEATEVHAAAGDTITDTITNSDTSSLIGSTGATTWTDITVTGSTGAVYKIHTMGLNGTTNAFRWNKNGYLYVSTNPGSKYKIKSISVTTGANKSLDMYGSATAYTGKASSTKDGSLTATSSGATYTYNTQYAYAAVNGTTSSTEVSSITFTWEEQAATTSYSVIYDANGGSGTVAGASNISAASAANYTLASTSGFSRDGFECDGWATSANGAKVYDSEESGVDLTSFASNMTATLYAHWNKIETPNEIVFANEGLADATQYTTFGTSNDSDESDRSYLNFEVEFGGGSNDGKYYATGTGIRTYNSNGTITLTAKNNKKFGTVTFTWDGSNKPATNNYTVSAGAYDVSTGVWTGLSNSIVLTNTSTTGHWRLQSIEISLGTTLVTGITLSPSALNVLSDDTTTNHYISVTVAPEDADVPALTISSNNTNVATVSTDSLAGSGSFTITGNGATSGTQVVTVSATDGSGISATLTLTAVDASVPVLTGITVNQSGLVKTTQYVGNAFDPDGLTFTPVYNKTNPSPATITSSDFTWSTLVAGEDVVGTYNDDSSITVTIDAVTVKNDVLSVTISGDELTDPDFLTSESWNHDGITAVAEWESGTSYSGEIVWSYSPETPAAMGVDDAGVLTITATAGEASDSVDVLVTVTRPREVITERIDTINNAFTINEDTQSYSDWTNTGDGSGISYKGQSAGKGSTVQLRSNNSNSGIVTLSQHGYVKTIEIKFDSQTTADRTIDVYGKNSAYSAATDLYNASTQGTNIGSVTGQGGDDLTITVSGDYSYIGIRSNSGAVYLSEIIITWNYVHTDSDVTAVDTFISNKMHLDYDNGGEIGSTGGNGSCTDYYDKNGTSGAKYAFTQLTDVQKEIILKSTSKYGLVGSHEYTYDEIKDRLSEWARINGDTLNSETGVFSSARILPTIISGSTSSAAVIVIVVSLVCITAIGGYFFIRKHKEQ